MTDTSEKCADHERRVSLLEKIVERHDGTLKEHETKIEDLKIKNSEQDTNIKLFQKDLDFIKEQLKTMNATLIELTDKPKRAFDKYKDTIITIVITAIVTGIIAKLVKGW
ncbi:hemolysin XhlA family protein [Peptoniphilus sp. GNH]|nr:hemolysin XhlA family protein [Peptoniphilus sp. GNH]